MAVVKQFVSLLIRHNLIRIYRLFNNCINNKEVFGIFHKSVLSIINAITLKNIFILLRSKNFRDTFSRLWRQIQRMAAMNEQELCQIRRFVYNQTRKVLFIEFVHSIFWNTLYPRYIMTDFTQQTMNFEIGSEGCNFAITSLQQ